MENNGNNQKPDKEALKNIKKRVEGREVKIGNLEVQNPGPVEIIKSKESKISDPYIDSKERAQIIKEIIGKIESKFELNISKYITREVEKKGSLVELLKKTFPADVIGLAQMKRRLLELNEECSDLLEFFSKAADDLIQERLDSGPEKGLLKDTEAVSEINKKLEEYINKSLVWTQKLKKVRVIIDNELATVENRKHQLETTTQDTKEEQIIEAEVNELESNLRKIFESGQVFHFSIKEALKEPDEFFDNEKKEWNIDNHSVEDIVEYFNERLIEAQAAGNYFLRLEEKCKDLRASALDYIPLSKKRSELIKKLDALLSVLIAYISNLVELEEFYQNELSNLPPEN